MAEMSRRFNETAFWDHVDEVLLENERAMTRIRRPGEIGAVACSPSFLREAAPDSHADTDPLPEPPEVA